MAITMKDLANELGLSRSVVSRALNPNPDNTTTVANHTKQLVRTKAKEMGYRHNRIAESLRRGQYPVIGVFMPEFSDSMTSDFLRGLSEALNDTGFYFKIYYGDIVQEYERFLRNIADLSLSALICGIGRSLISDNNLALMRDYSKQGGKIILQLDRNRQEREFFKDFVFVGIDNYNGGKIAAEHFLKCGCRSFIVQKVIDWPTRYDGFIEALSGNVIKTIEFADMRVSFDPRRTSQLRHYLRTLAADREKLPIGFFVQSDRYAPHVTGVIKELGLEFKKDIFLLGYDDLYMSKYLEPALSTVHQPFYEIGHALATKAVNSIMGKKVESQIIQPLLKLRDSG